MGKRKKPSKSTRDKMRAKTKKATKEDVLGASELRKNSAMWTPEVNKAIFGKENPSADLQAQENDYRTRHRARVAEIANRGQSDARALAGAKVSESARDTAAMAADDVLFSAADEVKAEGLTPTLDPSSQQMSVAEIEEAKKKLEILDWLGVRGPMMDSYRAELLSRGGISERN